jgi:ZIP family zinc transporter
VATFAARIADIKIAIPIAIAMAIHNIPEAIAISIPIYYSTDKKRKEFFLLFLSGLVVLVGTLIGYHLLSTFFSETLLGILFGSIAGIIVFISVDELLLTVHEYGFHYQAIFGLIAGMIVMAIS